jgi:hypothetical protein
MDEELRFLSTKHKIRFEQLLRDQGISHSDCSRSALLFIITGNLQLFEKRHVIYDFEENMIRLDCFNQGLDFSSGERALVRLGFNLYNGYQDDSTSPFHLFYCLDAKSTALAMRAIKICFTF